MSVFTSTRAVLPCVALSCVAKMTWPCSVVINDSTRVHIFVCVCALANLQRLCSGFADQRLHYIVHACGIVRVVEYTYLVGRAHYAK